MDELDYQKLPLTRGSREKLKKLDAKRIQQFRDRMQIDPAGHKQHIENELIRGRLRDYLACLQESPGSPDDRWKLLHEFAARFVEDEVATEALATIDPSERTNALLVYTWNAAHLPDPTNRNLPRMNPNIARICREILQAYGEAHAADGRHVPSIPERAARRRAVIMPILEIKGWTIGELVTRSGVGKATVYEYLNGKRAWISFQNGKDIAGELGIDIKMLPDIKAEP